MSTPDYAFVAWNSLSVVTGPALRSAQSRALPLDWQPELIQNCSFAAGAGLLGIAGRDKTDGQWAVRVFNVERGRTAHSFLFTRVLRHALTADGTLACVTTLSEPPMVADLEILRIDDGQAEPILRAQVHQGSPLSWFPDGDRIALQSPDDQVLIVDRNSKHMERVAEGQAPVVSPDGSRIAFKRSGAVFILELSPGNTQRVDTGRAVPSTELAWSPDGRCLTFGTTAGLTGKETRFHLYDLEASRDHKLPLRYMTGLAPV